jgi:hypothetical protein
VASKSFASRLLRPIAETLESPQPEVSDEFKLKSETVAKERWCEAEINRIGGVVCQPTEQLAVDVFAFNLSAKRRLCNTVRGRFIDGTTCCCAVSTARPRAVTTTNLARSNQSLLESIVQLQRHRLPGVSAEITIQLDLGRRSLTVPPPSRPPCRSRWEARRFGPGA